jgi:hypothetical protein
MGILDMSVLQWNSAAIKRFENKLGIRNLFSQISEYIPKPFENISTKFSVNKFEKLVSSKAGKDFLGINNQDGIFTMNSPEKEKELEKKISTIIKDIDNNFVKTKTVQNSTNITEYFNSIDNANKTNINLIEKLETDKMRSIKSKRKIELKLPDNNGKQILIKKEKFKYIKEEKKSVFLNLNIKNLNYDNPRAIGIQNLCYEIQQMSRFGQENKFKISFCFLIRSLLEQSAIYFLINKNNWDLLRSQYGNRDLRLEKIIIEIEKRKSTYFDDTILRCWNTITETTTAKDYFDLIVHHPYLINASINIVNNIGESGLFAIVQFFINSKL